MIQLVGNTKEVAGRILDKIDDLEDAEIILNGAVFDVFADMKERIQQRGEKSDGGKMRYVPKASKKPSLLEGASDSAYSPRYSKKRKKKGRQTDHVDLTMTGDMMDRAFTVIPLSKNEIGIGFQDDENFDKAQFNEERYGKIFMNTDEEIDSFLQTIKSRIKNVLRGNR